MSWDNIKFISNNVREIKNSEKRVKIFEYLKNNIRFNEVVLLWETRPCEKNEKECNEEFKELLFFSQGTTNSCRVAIE